MYDNDRVGKPVLDDFIADSPYESVLGVYGKESILVHVFLEEGEVKVSWKSLVNFPEDTYYIDGALDGIENEHTKEILQLTGISKLEITPHHPDGEVQKIKRVYHA